MTETTRNAEFIINEALIYAAHFIDGLPVEHQSRSMRDDMLRILRARLGDTGYKTWVSVYELALMAATKRPFDATIDGRNAGA